MKKFNLIDGLIVIVLILGVAFGAMRLAGGSNGDAIVVIGQRQVTARYKVEFTRKMENMLDKFEVDDTVFIGERERTEGVIVDREIRPCRLMTFDGLSGEYIWADVPNRYDIVITIESSAIETNDAIRADGVTKLHVGEEFVVQGKGYAGLGFMIDLEVVGGDA